ncbi:MAG: methyltransferase domain-containing protein [Lachnospiraceae bacterium]|nr:methyltransferase domain-containing protein [Lachnospiraceae bacterium]
MENEKVVIFGAGLIGEKVYKILKEEKKDIIMVIDNDRKKIGSLFFEKIPIIDLLEYKEKYDNKYKIYIAISSVKAAIRQLNFLGIYNYVEHYSIWETNEVLKDDDIAHGNWPLYLQQNFNKEGYEVLEIGSRVVTGRNYRNMFNKATYTGVDIYPGENVDIVYDVHKLSEKLVNKKYDLIYSSAVFEHLAMPWKASMEIIKLLKVGGYVFIETHYSYSSHERPWHFFQFSESALEILFPECFGIECIKKGCSNLLESYFSEISNNELKGKIAKDMYCHSGFLGKKVREVENLSWEKIRLEDVVGDSRYPKIKK